MSDFTALHRAGDPPILPNVRDVASARCLAEAGFRAHTEHAYPSAAMRTVLVQTSCAQNWLI
jgi:2-methylisocitrate lyase-like PEP mutase family enzyme